MAKPATTTTTNKPATATKKPGPRVAPVLTAPRNDLTMPIRLASRGTKSLYGFETLEVGFSIGVKNKSAKQMASIVSNQNRKYAEVVRKDASGNVIFKTQNVNGTSVPTTEPETYVAKHFFAVDVDAKTDPDGASVRIWRDI